MTSNNQTIYEQLNYFEPIPIIAGSGFEINFVTSEIDDDDVTVPLDLTSATSVGVRFSYLGDANSVVITKVGTITDAANGEWGIMLETLDTINLEGVFTMQPVITAYNGTEYLPGQGQVSIFPQNKDT